MRYQLAQSFTFVSGYFSRPKVLLVLHTVDDLRGRNMRD